MTPEVRSVGGALVAQSRRLDVVAHELATSTVSGQRARRAAFSLQDGAPQLDTGVVAAPGAIRHTGEPLDLAISGDGFFVVQGPDGQVATRRGDVSVDADGFLSVGGRQLVGDSGPIPRGDGPLIIADDGTASASGQVLGRIRLVALPDLEPADADGNFILPSEATELAAHESQVRQGHIEGSNLDVVQAATDMATSRRGFEMATRAFNALLDDVVGGAIRELDR